MADLRGDHAAQLMPGTRVEVRTRFVGSWSGSFEIAQVSDGGYRVRRLSDGTELPSSFPPDEVRAAK